MTDRFVVEDGPEDWMGCPCKQLRDTRTDEILFIDGGESEDMTLDRDLAKFVTALNHLAWAQYAIDDVVAILDTEELKPAQAVTEIRHRLSAWAV